MDNQLQSIDGRWRSVSPLASMAPWAVALQAALEVALRTERRIIDCRLLNKFNSSNWPGWAAVGSFQITQGHARSHKVTQGHTRSNDSKWGAIQRKSSLKKKKEKEKGGGSKSEVAGRKPEQVRQLPPPPSLLSLPPPSPKFIKSWLEMFKWIHIQWGVERGGGEGVMGWWGDGGGEVQVEVSRMLRNFKIAE